jgi:elongation factor G
MSVNSNATNHGSAPGKASGVRCAAIVGPYLSGKTSLLESLLSVCGAIPRKGSAREHTMIGDASPEARERGMGTELNVAHASFLDEPWVFLDCPGSVELTQEAMQACMVADVAIVVCEPDPARAFAVAPLLHFLDQQSIPHMLFVNKMDTAAVRAADMLDALQAVSASRLILRQVPIRDGETITGYVDLISERAYAYRKGEASNVVQLPASMRERERQARQEMLEVLADTDDALLETLLEEQEPDKGHVYKTLAKDVADDVIVPILLGAAESDGGVRRLLKALRHDTPHAEVTAARRSIPQGSGATVQVFRTIHAQHTGKTSLARIWSGTLREGASLAGERCGGMMQPFGTRLDKVTQAPPGAVVGLAKMEKLATGDIVTAGGCDRPFDWPETLPPLQAIAVHAANRTDDVKLSSALARLCEEDPSFSVEQRPETHQLLLWGQGEQHLQLGLLRLAKRFNVSVVAEPPQTPYRETIRRETAIQSRFKRQTGGHGQFADVALTIRPQPRGAGFAFDEKVVGGAVPRNFFPAVESGVRDYLQRGPLGFPVVDIAVTLTDGKHHAVDSSEMAFKTAARMGMADGMPQCEPVLLEPIVKVALFVPSSFTANVQRLLSGRRAQILGFDAREGWPGWDAVQACLPQSEMYDMIVELRSLTQGVGTFTWVFDHLQELTGRTADEVVKRHAEAAE